MAKTIEVLAEVPPGAESILSAEALAFVEKLHRQFQPVRQALLKRRAERQAAFDAGALPKFLSETEPVRTSAWKVADGRPVTQALYETIRGEELGRLGGPGTGRLREAAEILDGLVGPEEFVEFLTLPAYGYLD